MGESQFLKNSRDSFKRWRHIVSIAAVFALILVYFQNCAPVGEPGSHSQSSTTGVSGGIPEPNGNPPVADICKVNYVPPKLNSVPGPQTVLFGMGNLSGTVNPQRASYSITQGSLPVEIDCDSNNQRINVDCNSQGARVTANNNNFECETGTATITVRVGDQCIPNNQRQRMSFVVNFQNTCLPENRVKASNPQRMAAMGTRVAIDGNTGIVSAPTYSDGSRLRTGAAYIFVKSGSTWQQQAMLLPSNAQAEGAITGVAIKGDVAVIGAPYHMSGNVFTGALFVYRRSGTSWSHVQTILGPQASALEPSGFGYEIAINSNQTIFAGAFGDDVAGVNAGAVYIYNYNGTNWSQSGILRASDASAFSEFGASVAANGSLLVVGAPIQSDEEAGRSPGKAYIFRQSGSSWTQEKILRPQLIGSIMQYGGSVGTDGTRVIVGARLADAGDRQESGAAYIYESVNGQWQEKRIEARFGNTVDRAARDYFGTSVALQGNRAVVSSPGNGDRTGAAYVFALENGNWNAKFKVMARRPFRQARTYTGQSIALSGTTLLMGSPADNDDGRGGAMDNSGAAYFVDLN